MSSFNFKGALAIVVGIFVTFGLVELYGISTGGDWSVLVPTVLWQLVAITIIVTPMIYGLIYDSEADEE
ncbi:MAG: hypothetical protein AAF682_01815 [Planctomycetota bacterium]